MERELPQTTARVDEDFNRLMAVESEIGTYFMPLCMFHSPPLSLSLSLSFSLSLSLIHTPFFPFSPLAEMQILTGEEKCKELEVHVYILLFANVCD